MHACCGGLSGAPQRAGRKGYKALTVTQEVRAFSVPPQDRELWPEEIEGKEFGEEPQVWEGWVRGGMGWGNGAGASAVSRGNQEQEEGHGDPCQDRGQDGAGRS